MKQRIVWLDSLKGFLILLVVVGHSIQEVGMHNFPGGEWIWYFIYSFHMMAFFAGFPSMPAAAYFVIFSAMGIGIPILLEKGMNKVPGLQFVFHPLHRAEKILCEG